MGSEMCIRDSYVSVLSYAQSYYLLGGEYLVHNQDPYEQLQTKLTSGGCLMSDKILQNGLVWRGSLR